MYVSVPHYSIRYDLCKGRWLSSFLRFTDKRIRAKKELWGKMFSLKFQPFKGKGLKITRLVSERTLLKSSGYLPIQPVTMVTAKVTTWDDSRISTEFLHLNN